MISEGGFMNIGRWLTLLAVVASGMTQAAAAPASPLVSATWLADHLHDADLVVLAADDGYGAGHIPGARQVSLQNVSVERDGLRLEMPSTEDLRLRLAALGISDRSRIVVYYGSVTVATRILFTLDYAGFGGVSSVLDGGMAAWTRGGHPVSTDVPPARTGTIGTLSVKPIVVDAAFVVAHLKAPHFAVVDARATAFYDGSQPGGPASQPQRPGHIAGALSVPYSSVVDDRMAFRTADDLTAIFAKAGVKPDDTIIGYCHIGQQATAMLLAARSIGHPVLLYDGSFEDWSRHPEYPVDNPAGRSGRR
jgi:thiosulfate/3-mercaptopyruvate sulfurtransferase